MANRGSLVAALGGVVILVVISGPLCAEDTPTELDADKLEREGVTIERVVLQKEDVFDLNDPRENNWFYRWANKLHIITKDQVITKQMLLGPGDAFSKRLAKETERILRSNLYFYDATVQPVNQRDGKVDLLVKTKDVWTLNPGFSISRKGGENKTIIDIEEVNLFGRGQLIRAARTDDVDRVSKSIEFQDKHLGDTWMSMRALYADNSDGESAFISLLRPFYALDSRWSAGGVVSDLEQRGVLYDLGEKAAEFRHEREYYSAFGGWSKGLRDGWVRRYTAGVVYDENRFSEVPEPTLPAAIPADRKLIYPFVGVEVLQDKYETTSNRDQIKKTEDFLTGTRFSATIGWSDNDFGADRDALIYTANASRWFGELDASALSLAGQASGRLESGNAVNALLSVDARFSHRFSDNNTFFATVRSSYGHKLDLESPVELGGDTGLRGYPLRYQTGDSSFLLSLEQRVFWDWYPLRLFRVGGAVFADVGRTWGDHPLAGEELGWLRDAGVGLRFAPTRTSSRKIVHLDIAFPLDGDASIDEIQIILESKKSF